MTVWTSDTDTFTPLLGYEADPFDPTGVKPVFGPPITIDGFRLIDSRASYGVGLETFALRALADGLGRSRRFGRGPELHGLVRVERGDDDVFE